MTTSTVSFEEVKKSGLLPIPGRKMGYQSADRFSAYLRSFIIPIVPLLPIFGYFGQIMKSIIVKEQDPEMPAWNDWGTLFLEGIKLWGRS